MNLNARVNVNTTATANAHAADDRGARVAYAVIEVPSFSLQSVLRHAPELARRAVALVDAQATTPRVIEATPAARREGVVEGLTAPQALARCRQVVVRQRSAADERVAMEALLQCAYAFSPHLEASAPGRVTLDLRGLSALGGVADAAGGECDPGDERDRERLAAWAARLLEALATLQLQVAVGLGPTPNLARLAARWGSSWAGHAPSVAATDGEGKNASPQVPRPPGVTHPAPGVVRVEAPAAFVESLPVEALEPSSDVASLLARWGIRRVGQLLALGQAELSERLGLEALALFAAASTTATRPLRTVAPGERFEERHRFEAPIESLEPVLFFLRRFVDALAVRLEACGLAAGSLRLRFVLENAQHLEWTLRLPQPARRSDLLFRVLQTHLENLRTDSPVLEVELVAEPARVEQKQFSLFEAALRDPHQFQETLARLAALVGADRVGTPEREDGHRADAFTLVPPHFEGDPPAPAPEPPDLLRAVPLRRLRPAVPAQVITRASDAETPLQTQTGALARPLHVLCEVAGGRVRLAIGPWRTSGQWWDERRWEREEWEVSLHGGRVLRLVREGDAWRCEAVLD